MSCRESRLPLMTRLANHVVALLSIAWLCPDVARARQDGCCPGLATDRAIANAAPSRVAIGFPERGANGEDGVQPNVPRVPRNLHLPATTRALVERMWATSPTFRRQCARLGESSVVITVEFGLPGYLMGAAHAWTRMKFRDGIVTEALVLLASEGPDNLAHELEHVLEHVDGVDVRGAVERGVRGAHRADHGNLETARAVAIGRAVAREMRESSPQLRD
jgi:hypothetical protein